MSQYYRIKDELEEMDRQIKEAKINLEALQMARDNVCRIHDFEVNSSPYHLCIGHTSGSLYRVLNLSSKQERIAVINTDGTSIEVRNKYLTLNDLGAIQQSILLVQKELA